MPRPPVRMRPADAVWLHMDRPESLMMITALLEFEGRVPFDTVAGLVAERLVAVYPRFSQRIRPGRLGVTPPAWDDAPAFDLTHHVVATPLPAPAGRAELEALVSRLMSTPLDPERPPWQVHVILDVDAGARTAIVVRIHHAVADGISLARVVLSMADDIDLALPAVAAAVERHPRAFHRPSLARAQRRDGGSASRVRDALQPATLTALGRLGADVTKAAAHLLTLPPRPPTALRGPLGVDQPAAWTAPQPLPRLKAACRALGCTLNDALLAAMAGALRRYLGARGSVLGDLRAFVPVNLRPLDRPVPIELGNLFSLAVLPLPVGEPTVAGRLTALKRAMDAIKASQEPAVAYGILSAMGATPPRVERALLRFFGTKASAVMTNVPGPPRPVAMGGHTIRSFLFWVPMSAGVSLGISIFSYAGHVSLGVAADAGLVPDPEALVAAWEAELSEIEALADPPQALCAE